MIMLQRCLLWKNKKVALKETFCRKGLCLSNISLPVDPGGIFFGTHPFGIFESTPVLPISKPENNLIGQAVYPYNFQPDERGFIGKDIIFAREGSIPIRNGLAKI